MDNAQKAIMVGVGLFITIIIISAVLLIVNLGTGLVDDASDNLGSISASLQNELLRQYDNKQLTGIQVKDAMQKYMNSNEIAMMLVSTEPYADSGYMTKACVGRKNTIYAPISFANGIGVAPRNGTVGFVNYPSINATMRDFNDKDNEETYIHDTSRYISRIVYLGNTKEDAVNTNRVLGVIFIPLAAQNVEQMW